MAALLVLEIEDGRFNVYVHTRGSWIPASFVKVVYLLDEAVPVTETWITKSRSRAYSPDPQKLLTALKASQMFTVRLFNENGKASIFTFDVTGIPQPF